MITKCEFSCKQKKDKELSVLSYLHAYASKKGIKTAKAKIINYFWQIITFHYEIKKLTT